ncbi:MAG: queuosine precursor transporter [Patescibacteria group bacterium]|nr:queuosine precursor transporter [Patescibacteria group bacterium]
MKKTVNLGLLSSAMYVAAQVSANIMSTKIILLPLVLMSVDGGTIIYPLTFTLRDFVHKTWGKNNARQLVVIAAVFNLMIAGLFWVVGKLPADPTWPLQQAYEQLLMPVGRIVMASVISQIVSELIDTEIFSFVFKKVNDVLAVFISNFFGLIVDSVVFSLLAFFGSLPLSTVISIIIANILIKLIVSIISTPLIKLIPRTVDLSEI